MGSTTGRVTAFSLAWGGKLLFAALVVGGAALGMWIGSALAAYQNGPIWVAIVAGFAAFPLLPVGWELLSRLRKRSRSPVLTTFDRLVLRTLVINVVLLGTLFSVWPRVMFTALSARGDWMLDGRGDWADPMRRGLFFVTDRLEWLHLWLNDNPYDDMLDDEGADAIEVDPVDEPTLEELRRRIEEVARPDAQEAEPAEPADPYREDAWPWRPQLHPAVQSLPAAAETSVASVARYLADAEPDELSRLKALHDYVADRVAYDVASLRAGEYPPQDAQTVFEERLSVCAGYANLLKALGDEAGLEIVVVGGHARGIDGGLSGMGHAWNAARVGDRWYLLDATWDAGHVDGDTFTKEYETTYLMSPPEVFGISHFPDDDKWQLRAEPISRGEFLRQPNLRGSFFAHGLTLRSPQRSQTTVGDTLIVDIDNPAGYDLSLFHQARGAGGPMRDMCRGLGDGRYRCEFPGEGAYDVGVFGRDQFMGTLQVNATD